MGMSNAMGRGMSSVLNAAATSATVGTLANAASHNARVKYFGGRTPKLDIGRYGTDDQAELFTPNELAALRKGEPLEDVT